MDTPLTSKSMKLIENDRTIRRKYMKHVVEKKRRGRINSCLEQLKLLVLTAMDKKPEEYEKMEKADILEMTLLYLKKMKSKATSTCESQSYKHGYNSCMKEIHRYFKTSTLPDNIKYRLENHLKKSRLSDASSTARPTSAYTGPTISSMQPRMPSVLPEILTSPTCYTAASPCGSSIKQLPGISNHYGYSVYNQPLYIDCSESPLASTQCRTPDSRNNIKRSAFASVQNLLNIDYTRKTEQNKNTAHMKSVNMNHTTSSQTNSWRPWDL